MAGSKNENKNSAGSGNITTTTNLPGLKNIEVIVSHPMVIKENSSKPVKE